MQTPNYTPASAVAWLYQSLDEVLCPDKNGLNDGPCRLSPWARRQHQVDDLIPTVERSWQRYANGAKCAGMVGCDVIRDIVLGFSITALFLDVKIYFPSCHLKFKSEPFKAEK